MSKQTFPLLILIVFSLFSLGGCAQMLDSMGMKGAAGAAGMAGTSAGALGSSVYLRINGDTVVQAGGMVNLEYSLSGNSFPAPLTTNMTFYNDSWTSLTLSGSPALKDLGGWILPYNGTLVYGAVPSISVGVVSTTAPNPQVPASFSLVFTPPANSQDSRFRKRYRIDLVDTSSTHYAFDFEVEATIIC